MKQGISLKSERYNPWFKPWLNILWHPQSIVDATVYGQCLEYLGYITLADISKQCGQKSNIFFIISAWKRKKIKREECSQYQKVYGWKEEQYAKPEQKERKTKENPC